MKWMLLWALGTFGVVIVAGCILFLFARHRLHRYHRVDHRVATDAPIGWLFDPREPARLHRRLARVGTTASAVADDHRPRGRRARREEPSPLAVAATDLCAQAVAVDHQLARLAVLAAPARRRPLQALSHQVDDLEAAAAHLVSISAEVRAPRVLAHDHPEITDIRGRLDRLAQAQRELDALDTDAGLEAATTPTPPVHPARVMGRVMAARGLTGRR